MAHSEEGNLVVEMHKALDNHTPCTGTTSLLAHTPSGFDVRVLFDSGLPMSRRGHNRLDHAGQPDMLHRRKELIVVVGELISRCRQAQFLCRQTTYRLTVHRQESRVGSGYDTIAFFLQLHQRGCSNRLHLRDNECRFFLFDHAAQCLAVQHIEYMAAMSNLHGRRVGILIARNDLHAIALQFDGYFFSEFARAQ